MSRAATPSDVEAFAREARRYCVWARDIHDGDGAEALRRIVAVYEAALVLECPVAPHDATTNAPDLTNERQAVRARCDRLPIRYYSEGLWYFEQRREAEAAWTWIFLFRTHWGRHAASAIGALHAWLVESA